MFLVRWLSGPVAGSETEVDRLPLRIGRAPDADVRIESAGVWEHHFTVERTLDGRVGLLANPECLTLVNGAPAGRVNLRNGDLLEFGDVRGQFWLAPAVPEGLRAREAAAWLCIAGLGLVQVWACWWLCR